ncbi:ABC transporter permease [Candidatus Hydrogenedentota bacterium]
MSTLARLEPLRMYIRFVGIAIRGQMQYRASFVMTSISVFIMTALEFVAIWALFDRFSHLRGWSLSEVAFLYGTVNIAFSLCEAFGAGFDRFAGMVKGGSFDRVLLRPRRAAFQIAVSEIQAFRVGRSIQGVIILTWACVSAEIALTPAHCALALGAILGGACLFMGLFVLQATLAFWTIESLEVVNIFTYGGMETAQYPLTIYKTWFRRFFTFVVPIACINYFPALAIFERAESAGLPGWVPWLSPLLGVAFLVVSLQIWKVGVRHYRSTGS